MIRQEEHHEVKVWTETVMDELRKKRCLCLQCDHLQECSIAKSLYEICVAGDLAVAITRCRTFDAAEKVESPIDTKTAPSDIGSLNGKGREA